MTQEMPWLEDHVGSLEDGIELINRFHWFLSVVESKEGNIEGHHWFVLGGDQVLFSADTREAADAFLYGMALAYAVIPDYLFEYIVEATNDFK